MKSNAIVCAIAAGALSFGSLSFAQGWDHRGQSGGEQYAQRDNNRDGRDNRDNHDNRNNHEGRGNGWQNNDHRYDQRDNRQYGARGPEWRRGGYIPREYRDRQYVVNDWRGHNLSAPPRGYQWVQHGSDYLLVALATGLIAQLLSNR